MGSVAAGLAAAAILFIDDPFFVLLPLWLIVVSVTLLVTHRGAGLADDPAATPA